MKYYTEYANSPHYVFDETKMALKSLGVDTEPIFIKTYFDGHTEQLNLYEYQNGPYVAYRDIKDIGVGQVKNGVMKVSENRFKILQMELF